MVRLIILCLFFLYSFETWSQIFPTEGSKLHYRIIGFRFHDTAKQATYKLEIANGICNDENTFIKNLILAHTTREQKEIAEVPEFGKDYTWRIRKLDSKPALTKGDFHHFSTLANPNVDTTNIHLRIIDHAVKYKDAYVFVDGTHTLYDMEGKPVWFLPEFDSQVVGNNIARDIKMTDDGNITLVLGEKIFEINYNGDILWRGPNTGAVSGDTAEHYHHEFTKLRNGHYMTLGNTNVLWEIKSFIGDSMKIIKDPRVSKDSSNKYYQKALFGTVIEYDKDGKVVWSWNSANYFKNSDLHERWDNKDPMEIPDAHMNSFYFDERNKMVYISFRDISRILKVRYPEGTVVATYGKKQALSNNELANDLFCGQHSCKIMRDGTLCIFNNNAGSSSSMPKVVLLEEVKNQPDSLKKIWEYECTNDGMNDGERNNYEKMSAHAPKHVRNGRMRMTSGGNAVELPDGSLLVSMSGAYSKVFIVSRYGQISWSAVPEKWMPDQKEWMALNTYRASIVVEKRYFEKLILSNSK